MITTDSFECAIFDLDGTVVDSNKVWEKIDRMYLRRNNIPAADHEINAMAAMTYEECVEFLRKKKNYEVTEEELRREFDKMAVLEYRNNVFLKPYVREFLELLRLKGKKTALATASPRELYESALRHNGVYGMFDVFCTTDEAGRSKDYPDVYLLAAEKLGMYPRDCAVFEDVLRGIVSAKNAGMYTIGVYDRYSSDDAVTMRNTADRYIMDFSEMLIP